MKKYISRRTIILSILSKILPLASQVKLKKLLSNYRVGNLMQNKIKEILSLTWVIVKFSFEAFPILKKKQ